MRTFAFLAIILVAIAGCDKSTGPTVSTLTAYQVPGCVSGIAQQAPGDTCFAFEFQQKLFVQFCATGNCCPDSDRFSFRHSISRDTIYVTIADTAAQLCRCMCKYTLVMEFTGLEKNSYQFVCSREDYSNRLIIYSKRVSRN